MTETAKKASEPLTREKLERALVVFARTEDDGEFCADADLTELTDFFWNHAFELLGLALAALHRLEPKTRPGYERHALGPAQTKIVSALRAGKLTAREVSTATAIHERNCRRVMDAMLARGWLVYEKGFV